MSGRKGPRLTIKQLREIRRLCALRRYLLEEAKRLAPESLAAQFGIHEAHVRKIEKGRAWKEVA